jgi:hypothetical protein
MRRATAKPLCETEAIENGATVVTEISMLSVGAAFVLLDLQWTQHKKSIEQAERAELYGRIAALGERSRVTRR